MSLKFVHTSESEKRRLFSLHTFACFCSLRNSSIFDGLLKIENDSKRKTRDLLRANWAN